MAAPVNDAYPRKFGKYHLLGPLAQGGMGALYLACAGDRGLERLMVIKTVLPHLADAEYMARFRDEAKIVVNLSHGNVIPVFDAGVTHGEMFLAMDFVEGRDLRAVWNRCAKKQVAFPIDVAVHVVKELCRGLHYAHTLSDLELVHRDVSPPNVLVSFTGEVKLTDFGLASSTLKLEKTAPGIIYGKVAYMSPEQARGEKLDGRSDMYAAGIVLWELLTGRQLFPPGKDQPQDLVARAKNPEAMAPSKRAPRVPSELDTICLRALAADRHERYQNCDEMREALQAWLAKNAPTTDISRISTFMHDLFAEDMVADRAARVEMIAGLRKRALTLPPTDEFRQLVERSTDITIAQDPAVAFAQTGQGVGASQVDAPVRTPGSVGRRSDDLGLPRLDRRKSDDRRARAPSPENPGAATAAALDFGQEEAPVDLLGTIVDNRYRVVELVGEGGMGKVYLAEHVEIGRRVALKVLHPSYGRMPDLVERFRREARAASKIGHPNIVDVTDSGTTPNGSVFFVMEFLEGVELGSIIDREGAIDIHRALRIASQICRALAAAHNVGIIHRDLKPENIFLIARDNTADFVKVLDFGIAKTTEAEAARERKLTSPGMAMGTPEYMAPEQAAGRPADARCDVYALGAILFEMLTGVAPYQGENFMEILTKKATLEPMNPLTLRPEMPEAVAALVLRAMARNPEMRPQSMEAFEYELNKCLFGRGVAVASILGVSTDPVMMANLNPGSGAIALPRAASVPPPVGMERSPSGGLVAAGTQAALAASQAAALVASQAAASTNAGLLGVAAPPQRGSAPSLSMPLSPSVGQPSGSGAWGASAGSGGTPVPGQGSASGAWSGKVVTELMTSENVKVGSGGLAKGVLVAALAVSGAIGTFWAVRHLKQRTAPSAASVVADGQAPQAAIGQNPAATTPAPEAEAAAAKAVPREGRPAPTIDGRANSLRDQDAPAAPEAASTETPDTQPSKTAPSAPSVKVDKRDTDKASAVDSADKPEKGKSEGKRSAKDLIADARDAAQAGDVAKAKRLLAELGKQPGYAGTAKYEEAVALFHASKYEEAQRAARAASQHGFGAEALILEADAQYRMGQYDKAKSNYLAARRKVSSTAKRTDLEVKIGKCNDRLKLPARDGL